MLDQSQPRKRRRFPLTAGAACGAAIIGALAAAPAHATPILVFGEAGIGTPVTGTATGSSTTIGTTDALINISGIDAPLGNNIPAYLTFSTTSTDLATVGTNGNVIQNYSGTFSIYSGMGRTGTDYLSGTFTDLFQAVNDSATLLASTPPASAVTFTSSVIPASALGVDRAVSLSFVSVTPGITSPTATDTIPSFTAAISGNFSANPVLVPEPVSLTLLGAGLVAIGFVRRKRA